MPKKKLYNSGGIVYSTADDFQPSNNEQEEESLLPEAQLLKIILDKKHRGGKTVTIVKGFSMKEPEIENLGKKLKTFCGSGGTVKDKEIIVQGDHREKIFQWLLKNGFSKSRKI